MKTGSPPAFETRKRDGAVCPSKKTFNSSYLFVQKCKMPSRSKSFILSILDRTAPSKRKLFWCNIAKNEICELCNVVCDNYYVVAECMFSFMIITALRKYHNSKNINLTENTFAYLLRYPTFQVTSIVKSFIFYVKFSVKHDQFISLRETMIQIQIKLKHGVVLDFNL